MYSLAKHTEGHDAALCWWQDEIIAQSDYEPQDSLCLQMFQRCGMAIRTDRPTTSQR
jgi:hypothetical protein